MNKVIKDGLIDATATFLYIIAVSVFINLSGKIKLEHNNSFLAPIVFMMLFVFSASFTGYFVFGRPTLMYLDGKKKEAISVVSYTFIFLFCYLLFALIILLVSPSFIK